MVINEITFYNETITIVILAIDIYLNQLQKIISLNFFSNKKLTKKNSVRE